MKIKQVEELVGISKKNIRFYEEQGLLHPGRAENGYREYGAEDVLRLKQIKLLRKLSVSIDGIQKIFSGACDLETCLERHLAELERQKESLDQMQALSRRLIDSHVTLDRLDADACLEEMEQLEKEGARFMDAEKMDIHRKKTTGAVIGAAIMILIMGLMIALTLWGNTQEPLPVGLLAIVVGVPVVVIICIIVALIGRIKEIEGGEEDEASKY